ncbi:MAG: glycerophosphodiester phosphodiesterase [Verrucomicrobiota bacterium]
MVRIVHLLIIAVLTSETYSIDVIAHRGFTTESKENTLGSIREAWIYGADAVEVDIQMLNDETIVLFHDLELKGQKLATLTYRQLQALSPSYHVPTLDEALLEVVPEKSIILDLKSNTLKFASILSSTLGRKERDFDLIVQSSDLPVLKEIENKLSDSAEYQFLTKLEREGIVQREPSVNEIIESLSSSGISGVSAKGRRFIDESFVSSIQTAGFRFYVWTINEPKRIRHYLGLGVDGIITDNPGAREQIDAYLSGDDNSE